jgi:hypothetical protein
MPAGISGFLLSFYPSALTALTLCHFSPPILVKTGISGPGAAAKTVFRENAENRPKKPI